MLRSVVAAACAIYLLTASPRILLAQEEGESTPPAASESEEAQEQTSSDDSEARDSESGDASVAEEDESREESAPAPEEESITGAGSVEIEAIQAAPEPMPETVEIVEEDGAGHQPDVVVLPPEPKETNVRAGATQPIKQKFKVQFDGNVVAQYSSFTAGRFLGLIKLKRDADTPGARPNPNVGRNDGFGLGSARLNLRATYNENLHVRMGIDGSVVTFDDPDSSSGTFAVGIKDAYIGYKFMRQLELFAGRFKPPYDVAELTPVYDQYFVQRPLESRGVQRQEGFAGDAPGFRPNRQLGVMIASPSAIQTSNLKFGYNLAMTNGNGADVNLNDNEIPAFWLRLTGAWTPDGLTVRDDFEGPATYSAAEGVQVGLSSFWNNQAFGDPPNRNTDRVVGLGGDVSANLWHIIFKGQVLWEHTEHLTRGSGRCKETALGAHAQVSVSILDWGLAPGVRYAYYDPRFDTRGCGADNNPDQDRLQHISAGLRYQPPSLPIVLLGDYTRAIEQRGRRIENDRVELSAQVIFD